jgi:hypothetical protein
MELRKLSLDWYPLLDFLQAEYKQQFIPLHFEKRLDLVLSCPGAKSGLLSCFCFFFSFVSASLGALLDSCCCAISSWVLFLL